MWAAHFCSFPPEEILIAKGRMEGVLYFGSKLTAAWTGKLFHVGNRSRPSIVDASGLLPGEDVIRSIFNDHVVINRRIEPGVAANIGAVTLVADRLELLDDRSAPTCSFAIGGHKVELRIVHSSTPSFGATRDLFYPIFCHFR